MKELSDFDLARIAKAWMQEIEANQKDGKAGDWVIIINFFYPPEVQWRFILQCVNHAKSSDQCCAVGVGPVEHLLGFHGENWISRIERLAAENETFREMIQCVWRHKMTDDVWKRVQALQRRPKTSPVAP